LVIRWNGLIRKAAKSSLRHALSCFALSQNSAKGVGRPFFSSLPWALLPYAGVQPRHVTIPPRQSALHQEEEEEETAEAEALLAKRGREKEEEENKANLSSHSVEMCWCVHTFSYTCFSVTHVKMRKKKWQCE
jgi:hypothetical protein